METNGKENLRDVFREIAMASAITVPAVRMKFIEIGPTGKPLVHPVVAIESRVNKFCSKQFGRNEHVPLMLDSAEDAERTGWRNEGEFQDFGVVFVDHSSGKLISSLDFDTAICAGTQRIVCCTWPAEEDDKRLKPVIEKLLRQSGQPEGEINNEHEMN